MHDVGGAGDGLGKRGIVKQISLDEFQLVKVGAKGLAQRCNLGLILSISHSAAYAELTALKEVQADLGANEARNTRDGGDWFSSVDHLLKIFSFNLI